MLVLEGVRKWEDDVLGEMPAIERLVGMLEDDATTDWAREGVSKERFRPSCCCWEASLLRENELVIGDEP